MDKISVIGAGSVGSSLAWLILINKLSKRISLIDIDEDWAKGIACDLNDSRFILKSDTFIEGSSDYSAVKDSDIIVVTAGSPRKPGMRRQDLLKINAGIISSVSKEIKKHSPGSIVILVTNPLDLMVYVALENTGFSSKRVFGMGSSLDSSRLANFISQETGVSVKDITPLVMGMHSKDMLVSKQSKIGVFSIEEFIPAEGFLALKEKTCNRGKEIVDYLKKGSARFGPAAAVVEIIEAIDKDSQKIIPVSCLLENEFSLGKFCTGMPCVIGKNGIEKVLQPHLLPEEKKLLSESARSFQESLKCLTD